MNPRRPAVFLDRDGVINRTVVSNGVPHPPQSVAECEILPGVAEACGKLKAAGFPLIVVTNQPDVARGAQTRDEVERINQHLRLLLPIDAVYVCYHDTADDCDCRKPRPGMLIRAAEDLHLDLGSSYMVGDRSGDILAGAAAGCTTLLIDLPYSKGDRCEPDFRVASLLEAAGKILISASR
ncbi:D-glycero-alpha-D-manno-heptose-1,7-bisphosphate 7-phosphatase [Humisphaera borealis]|uniref:D,D-heptose 1,7-bisphosphate phosphatase n=1 Tax=Humisphaera borealis TaxID=2807512 RepID=A0A7M2X1W1_9BACT|nr:HAD family hydrolase [Humisphaera borealis]QOV91728.1 HAD family hydrolase [Humisphaera borealis]